MQNSGRGKNGRAVTFNEPEAERLHFSFGPIHALMDWSAEFPCEAAGRALWHRGGTAFALGGFLRDKLMVRSDRYDT